MINNNKRTDKNAPVYISGPITSLLTLGEDWRRPFNDAETVLRRLGFKDVRSPVYIAEDVEALCREEHREPSYADYMKADLTELLQCKTILMLRGWEGSKGALLEYGVAEALHMEIMYER